MNRLIGKSVLIWAAIIPLAIANGALRELVLIPLVGGAGLPASGILLAAMIYGVVLAFLPRLGRGRRDTYVKMGLVWMVCTVIFETILGLLRGDSVGMLLDNYNITTGNLWLLVVIFVGFAPWLAAKRRGMISQ